MLHKVLSNKNHTAESVRILFREKKKKKNIMVRAISSRRLPRKSRSPSYARKCLRNIAVKCHQKPTVAPFEFDLNFIESQSDCRKSDREPIRSESLESQSKHVLKIFTNILETWSLSPPGCVEQFEFLGNVVASELRWRSCVAGISTAHLH